MAQARDKRRQRAKKRRPTPRGPSPLAKQRSTRLRRVVIAFLILVGLAGILAVSADDGNGSGTGTPPQTASQVAR